MSTQVLVRLIKAMFTLLILAFLYVALIGTFSPSDNAGSESRAYAEVLPGQTKMQRYQGQRVWVTHVNPDLLTQLFSIQADVGAGDCALQLGLCVLTTQTSRDGVYLRYSQTKPMALDPNITWLGGFIDPTSGQVFDPIGRPYLPAQGVAAVQMIQQLDLP